MKRLLLTLVAALAVVPAFAQAPDSEPPAQVKAFAWMVGTWTGKGSFSMQGTESEVTIKQTCAFDGQFLKMSVVNDMGMFVMTETMFLGWDDAKGEYVSWSFTNLSSAPRTERGKMEGDVLTMVSDPWSVMGMDMKSRSTVAKKSDTSAEFSLEIDMGAGFEKAISVTLNKS